MLCIYTWGVEYYVLKADADNSQVRFLPWTGVTIWRVIRCICMCFYLYREGMLCIYTWGVEYYVLKADADNDEVSIVVPLYVCGYMCAVCGSVSYSLHYIHIDNQTFCLTV